MLEKIKNAARYLWHHKKAVAAVSGTAVVAAIGAMAMGIVPTPEIMQPVVQTIVTTVELHPTESLIAGSAVGGVVGLAALKKAYKGSKRAYSAIKSMKTANPKKLAEQAVEKVKGIVSKGGEQASQDQAKINWDKAKWFIAET